MSLLFVESFDRLGSLTPRWGGAGACVLGSFGRNGSNGVQLPGDSGILSRSFDVQATTLIVGFALKTQAGGHQILRLLHPAGEQVTVYHHVDGEVSVFRGDTSGTLLGRSARSLRPNLWNYVEVKAVIADGLLGSVLLRVNGDAFFDLTALDTNVSAVYPWIGQIAFGGVSVGDIFIDDVYVCDGAGGSMNDFLGDVRVEAFSPNGAGNYSAWTIGGTSPAATLWESVDDGTPNDGTDLIETATAGDKATFTMVDLATASAAVLAVAVNARHRATAAGTRELEAVARLAGTDVTSPTTEWTSTDWWYSQFLLLTKPGGGSWALADVNNAELGVGVVT